MTSGLSSTPQQRLATLRRQLESADAYPWSNVQAWAARARPLIRESFSAHFEDFEVRVKEPRWTELPIVISGGRGPYGDEPQRDNFAEVAAAEERDNRRKSEEAKRQTLAWLDGLLEQSATAPKVGDSLERLQMLLDRFPLAVRALARRFGQRPPVQIADEYDLQYVLQPMLIGSFHDVRPEEWTPSYAGGASRMDFLLKRDRLVLETKFVRESHSDKAIADELIIDAKRYQSHPDCSALVCFVYDPSHRLRHPEALEADLRAGGAFPVIVVVRPK